MFGPTYSKHPVNMGEDWLLEIVVKDKKHRGTGVWAPEQIPFCTAPGTKDWGTRMPVLETPV